ncbi:LysR family transcriptional regulator [Brevundimonas sp.]|uniref:LysR family transcriptional regulator n=1 Tax=Brevundimonas sp. TaxID=1871086 RepID=UPI0035AE56A5
MDDIRTFDCIASSASLSDAARRMGLSTAAVSRRLEALESRLGVRLVTRTSRLFRLTTEGEQFHRDCRRILSDLAEAEETVSRGATTPHGLLRLAAPISFGRRRLAPLFAEFRNRNPGVDLQLVLTDGVDELGREEYDAVIRIGAPTNGEFVARRLLKARRAVCASPDYLARCGTPRTPAELAMHDAIVIMRDGRLLDRWMFDIDGVMESVTVKPALSTNNGEVVHEWLLAGAGIGMKSVWDVGEDLERGRLVELFPDTLRERADIFIVYPDRRNLPLRVRALIDFLSAELKQAGAPSEDSARALRQA